MDLQVCFQQLVQTPEHTIKVLQKLQPHTHIFAYGGWDLNSMERATETSHSLTKTPEEGPPRGNHHTCKIRCPTLTWSLWRVSLWATSPAFNNSIILSNLSSGRWLHSLTESSLTPRKVSQVAGLSVLVWAKGTPNSPHINKQHQVVADNILTTLPLNRKSSK